MHKYLPLLLLLTTFTATAQQSNETISVDGTTRDYILYKPAGFDPQNDTLPLVFVLHGLGGNHSQMTGVGFNAIADTAQFHVIYPLGIANSFGQNSWNNGTSLSSNVNDVNFISKLIDKTNQDIGIDLERVYVAGLSMGGIMSFRLALMLNERIAAIASMVGTISTTDKQSGTPNLPVPTMQWHGTEDQVVPYDGTPLPSLELVQPTINFWKDANKCSVSDSTIINLPNTQGPNDTISVEQIIYHANNNNGCDSAELEHWKFTNGSHTWYNGLEHDVDGATEFWLFFRNKKHSNPAPVGQTEYKSVDFTIYPNPISSDTPLKITSGQKISFIEIFDASGKQIERKTVNGKEYQLVHNLPSGIYTIAVHVGNNYHSKPLIVR